MFSGLPFAEARMGCDGAAADCNLGLWFRGFFSFSGLPLAEARMGRDGGAADWVKKEIPLSVVQSHGEAEATLTDCVALMQVGFVLGSRLGFLGV